MADELTDEMKKKIESQDANDAEDVADVEVVDDGDGE